MRHLGTVYLETPRLILRRLAPQDAQAVYRNYASDDEVTRYLTWPTHRSVEATAAYVAFVIASYEKPSSYQWGIELKELGQIVGTISVVDLVEETEAVELGWVLGRDWWGQEIMPEAARAVIRFLFDEVGVNRISAVHDVENPKSGRVMRKIGMRREGTLRGAGKNNRGIVDLEIYGMLKGDARQ